MSSTLMFTHLGAAGPTLAQWLCLFVRVCRLIRSVVGSNASYDCWVAACNLLAADKCFLMKLEMREVEAINSVLSIFI